MSEQYDKYLKEHIDNVQKAWNEVNYQSSKAEWLPSQYQ